MRKLFAENAKSAYIKQLFSVSFFSASFFLPILCRHSSKMQNAKGEQKKASFFPQILCRHPKKCKRTEAEEFSTFPALFSSKNAKNFLGRGILILRFCAKKAAETRVYVGTQFCGKKAAQKKLRKKASYVGTHFCAKNAAFFVSPHLPYLFTLFFRSFFYVAVV